jgi:hypothetical protein
MGGGAVEATVRHLESEVVEDFRVAGATTPAEARSLADIGIGEGGAFERLCEREVIRQPTPGCFYLDEEAWNAIRSKRSRMGAVLVVMVLLIGAAVAFWLLTTG